jgi:hypothetical protein
MCAVDRVICEVCRTVKAQSLYVLQMFNKSSYQSKSRPQSLLHVIILRQLMSQSIRTNIGTSDVRIMSSFHVNDTDVAMTVLFLVSKTWKEGSQIFEVSFPHKNT